MSQSDRERAGSTTRPALPDRELSDAELESIAAAGGGEKGNPDGPHKKPEPPKYP